MAKKHKRTELKRPPTKRQLSKWQRQQRIQRIIVIVGSLFFALIAGYIGYGYYNEQVKPFNQPVVKVNDAVFNMGYYVKLLELYSQGQDFAGVSSTADRLVEIIEYGEVIKKSSADLGISVSTDEVDRELKNLGLPDKRVYMDAIISRLLVAKLLKDYFDPKVPTECEQVQVQAMFLESKDAAKKLMDRLRAGEDFSSLAKEYSLEVVTKEKGGDLGWLPKGFANVLLGDLGDSLLEDIAFSLESGMLSEPTYDKSVTKRIGYWLVEVIEKDEKKGSHARGILLGSRQEAEEIKARIEAGEDFATLAREYSQHSLSKEQGGDLGWTGEGIVNKVVMGLALRLEPNVPSQPATDASVETNGGYWLVKVVDKDDSRQLEDQTREMLKFRLFEDWLSQVREKNSIERYLSRQQKSWAVARVLKNRG